MHGLAAVIKSMEVECWHHTPLFVTIFGRKFFDAGEDSFEAIAEVVDNDDIVSSFEEFE